MRWLPFCESWGWKFRLAHGPMELRALEGSQPFPHDLSRFPRSLSLRTAEAAVPTRLVGYRSNRSGFRPLIPIKINEFPLGTPDMCAESMSGESFGSRAAWLDFSSDE